MSPRFDRLQAERQTQNRPGGGGSVRRSAVTRSPEPVRPPLEGSRPGPLVLASASPRRRQLLQEAGIAIRVDAADVDETALPGETAAAHVRRLALAKADAVAGRHPQALVLGADTVVVLDGVIFGKPADLAHAQRMLAALSGRWHEVLTGVALVCREPAQRQAWVCRTRVRFAALPAETIQAYCTCANPLDKAGAYGIQEHGEMLVAEIAGLRSNVIGLPIEEVVAALRRLERESGRTPTSLS
jgi:septum formation protein